MRPLIGLGKVAIVLGALMMVIGGTVEGWMFGAAQDAARGVGSAYAIGGAVAGFVGGLITAGAIFGLAAAFFEIELSLRRIADASLVAPPAMPLRDPAV